VDPERKAYSGCSEELQDSFRHVTEADQSPPTMSNRITLMDSVPRVDFWVEELAGRQPGKALYV